MWDRYSHLVGMKFYNPDRDIVSHMAMLYTNMVKYENQLPQERSGPIRTR